MAYPLHSVPSFFWNYIFLFSFFKGRGVFGGKGSNMGNIVNHRKNYFTCANDFLEVDGVKVRNI